MLNEILSAHLGPVPVWLIIAGGAVAIAIFAPKLLANFGGGSSTGSTSAAAGTTATADPNIDPVTGVPYTVEETTNPANGLPLYTSYNPPPPATSGASATTGSSTTTDPYAQEKATAIAQWQAHTGETWKGPAGSYPAGWIQPNVPGAATKSGSGQYTFIVPLAPTGSGVGPNIHPRWPYGGTFGSAPRAA